MKYQERKLSVTELGTLAGEEVLKYWQDNDIFAKSIKSREGKDAFVFYEGPPSANGTPGIHHVMARTIKDIFCRYQTLKGKKVARKGGWDTHGLPVELQVEKELGITKDDIGKKISVAEYNQRCREAVMKFKSQWDELTQRIGFWVDLQNPYITFENSYIETCWWLLKQLHSKNLLYKGFTIQPYSPAAGTGLSSHELNQPGCYKMVKDTSAVAQFRIKGTDNEYLLAWTTTPWTLPSNTALAIGKNITYVKVKTHNQYTNQPVIVIFAKERLDYVLGGKYVNRNDFDESKHSGKIPYIIVEEFLGETLIGMEYEQLMPYVQPLYQAENAFKVYPGDFVTTEDGTGIVHISPTFGSDDFRLAKQFGVPPLTVRDENGQEVPTVDKRGRFVKEITDFAGLYVKNYEGKDETAPDYKSTDVLISIKLKEENKTFKVEKYEHTYPHCWRTDKPVLYYPMDSWFIRTTALKDKLVESNKDINWKPESTGTGRFGNWLENLVDWNLSRSRYWGTPLPVWRTEDGSEEICIGSMKDLAEEIGKANQQLGLQQPTELADLHRPYVDEITLVSASGKPMKRETDLIDVWFDSGAMPYAQWGLDPDKLVQGHPQPFRLPEGIGSFEELFPADFISEGVDQTRGWFFTLHTIAGLVFDKKPDTDKLHIAFKNVLSTGLVLDAHGNKMSKRLGNVVNPFETVHKYGPDAVRWYMIANAAPWENLKFSLDGLAEMQRRFFGTLQNTYSFFALYANLDGFAYQEAEVPLAERTESDRWILSRLRSTLEKVDIFYDKYEPTQAARAISDFVNNDLSNWYVRLNRKRFWKGEYNTDKIAAYQTLYTCLETVAILASPIAPFYTEMLYRDLNAVSGKNAAESVHLIELDKLPLLAEGFIEINDKLEEKINNVQRICSLVHSIRKDKKIRVRQPLQKILLPVSGSVFIAKQRIEEIEELIKSEVNVKEIQVISSEEERVEWSIKPNFPALAKKGMGKKIKAIQDELNKMDTGTIQALVWNFREYDEQEIAVESGEKIPLTREDIIVETKDIAGWATARDGELTVALDITITPELRLEGIARDLVNRIQNIRKERDYDVLDKIHVRLAEGEPLVAEAVQAFGPYICAETQALSLQLEAHPAQAEMFEIDEFMVGIAVAKA